MYTQNTLAMGFNFFKDSEDPNSQWGTCDEFVAAYEWGREAQEEEKGAAVCETVEDTEPDVQAEEMPQEPDRAEEEDGEMKEAVKESLLRCRAAIRNRLKSLAKKRMPKGIESRKQAATWMAREIRWREVAKSVEEELENFMSEALCDISTWADRYLLDAYGLGTKKSKE